MELVMNRSSRTEPSKNTVRTTGAPKLTIRRRLLNYSYDFIMIVSVCVFFGLLYVLVQPSRLGFFCNDTSLQYPEKPDTIPPWLLLVIAGLSPIITFLIVELWVICPCNGGRRSHQITWKDRLIYYINTSCQTILLFCLGVVVCLLITEVGKRTIGRYRPYYITICNPIWASIQCTKTVQSASGSVVMPQYVIDHRCNTTASPMELREARLSFPSGHASWSTFSFVFLFIYFEARLVCESIRFFKPFLQCLCIIVAFFTSLSRILDYKHHATDVIAGATLGFSIAFFAAVRVGTYLWSFDLYDETEEEIAEEQLPQDERTLVSVFDRRQIGIPHATNATSVDNQPNRRSQGGNRIESQSDSDHLISADMMQSYGTRRVNPSNRSDDAIV